MVDPGSYWLHINPPMSNKPQHNENAPLSLKYALPASVSVCQCIYDGRHYEESFLLFRQKSAFHLLFLEEHNWGQCVREPELEDLNSNWQCDVQDGQNTNMLICGICLLTHLAWATPIFPSAYWPPHLQIWASTQKRSRQYQKRESVRVCFIILALFLMGGFRC